MYNDDELIGEGAATLLANAYKDMLRSDRAQQRITDGQARSIIAEMCDKCLFGQKRIALEAISKLMSSFPDGEKCTVCGYYDGMNKLYKFVCGKLTECVISGQNAELPLTIAVLLLLSDKSG